MMIKGMYPSDENEKGFVFIVCILLLFVLTIAGIATVRTSGTEVLTVRNQGQMIREFYHAETGLIDAFENPEWLLDNPFMTGDPTDPNTIYKPISGQDDCDDKGIVCDDDNINIARYKVRCIEVMGTTSFDGFPDVPPIQHIGPPPVNSGYSVQHFEIRRYAVTSNSTSGNTQVTGGVWKVFNKFN